MGDLWIKQSDGSWQERDQNVAGPVTPPSGDWTTNGIPAVGQSVAGIGVLGRSRTRLGETETAVGTQCGLWHPYYNGGTNDERIYALSDAQWAHSQGVIPWMTFKPGNTLGLSWAQIATGGADSWANLLAEQLGGTNKPVWVNFHHEPENDSGAVASNFINMYNRLAPIFKAYDNIAVSIILMGMRETSWSNAAEDWSTWMPNPANIDLYGYDPYNWWDTDNAANSTDWDELGSLYFEEWKAWKDSRPSWSHLRQVLAETAWTDSAAANANPPGNPGPGSQWLDRAWASFLENDGAGIAYFEVDGSEIGESATRTWRCAGNTTKEAAMARMFNASAKYPF